MEDEPRKFVFFRNSKYFFPQAGSITIEIGTLTMFGDDEFSGFSIKFAAVDKIKQDRYLPAEFSEQPGIEKDDDSEIIAS